MPSPVPLVGRKTELALIERFIQNRQTCDAIFIHGEGGIGKTRLLDEVREQFATIGSHPLITKVIDFNRPEMRTVEGIRQEIIESIGYRDFRSYLNAFSDWQKNTQIHFSSHKYQEEVKKLEELFIGCFNDFSGTKKVVILIDTVDEVTDVDIENLSSMCGLRNVLWVFAGRKSHILARALTDLDLFDTVAIQELKPLDDRNSRIYLARKQGLIHVTLEKEWIDKLILLTRGKPILLDLAVDWIARNVNIYADLPFGQRYEELCSLPDEELKQRRTKFEQYLVYRIAERRTLLDRLFIVLAQVYPLDTKGIAEFLYISEEEARAVMEKALTYSFIKTVADERLELHDEMRRMVNTYVWAKEDPSNGIDPSGRRRAHYNQVAMVYFSRLASEKKQTFEQILKSESDFSTAEQYLDYLWQRETLRGQFWGLVQKQLSYVEDSPGRKAILLELMRTNGLSPAQEVDTLLGLGNTLVRMAEYVSAAASLGQAVQISRRDGLTALIARSTNALGWCYRLMGKLDDALDCYGEALLVVANCDDEKNQALILNNMGYIYALRRNLTAALETCHQALALLESLDCRGDQDCEETRKQNLGLVYGTIATILTEFGQFEESLKYRERALGLFDKWDLERLSSNYLSRGITYWLMGKAEDAQRDLEEARRIGLEYEQHKIAHYLAHVARDKGSYDEAARLFTESYQKSQSLPDPFYELNNLGDLVYLAVRRQDFAKWQELEKEFLDYKDKWAMVQYDLPEGLLCKSLGDLALGAGQLEKAIGFYQQGLPLIASAGGYGPYTLIRQLKDTAELFQKSQPGLLLEVGTALSRFWLEQRLERKHPQILTLLAKWQQLSREDTNNE